MHHDSGLASPKLGMALWPPEPAMSTLPEFVGTIHIYLGPYRGNPIALYVRKKGDSFHISPTIYPWNKFVGIGETINKAAADFDAKWKEGDLSPDMYSGPHWEGGIKPEKPKPPPKPAAPPKPAITEPAKSETAVADHPPKAEAAQPGSAKPEATAPSPALPTDTSSAPAALTPQETKSSPPPGSSESAATVDPSKSSPQT